MKKKKKIIPLPFPIYYWTIFIIAAVGLADAVYLSISHYRVYTDMGYRSFCAITRSINCDTVSQSGYSIFLGFPVPFWGVCAYLFVMLLLLLAKRKDADRQRMWPLLMVVSIGFSVYSIILAAISTFIINSYCIMCIASYAINLMLVFYSWMIRNRFEDKGLLAGLVCDWQYLRRIRRITLP